jgi:hypothetical protein
MISIASFFFKLTFLEEEAQKACKQISKAK